MSTGRENSTTAVADILSASLLVERMPPFKFNPNGKANGANGANEADVKKKSPTKTPKKTKGKKKTPTKTLASKPKTKTPKKKLALQSSPKKKSSLKKAGSVRDPKKKFRFSVGKKLTEVQIYTPGSGVLLG